MIISKLTLKNILKSIKDYAIYFFTLILGVSIFYVFNAIDSQTVMLSVSSSTYSIIKLMTNMLSGVSVFVAFILGFLIIYASNFLIKRRKKEFGVYLTLGMSKRKIALILFLETLFIGILSLIVGLILGFFLSQLMSLLVANSFDADMRNFTFIFSKSAALKTLIYFSVMYLIVIIFNTISIGKCKLIDLLYGNKKSEEIKLKNPYLCVLVFIISVIFLSYAYYLVTGGFMKLDTADKIFIPIAIGIITTFLIFWSLSGLMLRIIMSLKKIYYRGLNVFTLRQISSKINTTVVSVTIICLMLFVTICVFSSALTLKNSLSSSLNKLAPADIELTKKMEDDKNIEESLQNINFNLNDYFNDYVTINIYQIPEITLKNTLGNKLDIILEDFKFLNYNTPEDIVAISDYNKIARLYGIDEYELNANEYIILANFKSMVNVRNIALQDRNNINILGKNLEAKYNECKDGFIEMSSNKINSGFIVVPDNLIDDTYIKYNKLIGNYKVQDKNARIKVDNLIKSKLEASEVIINSKLDIASSAIGLGALVTFIGLYLGIIFLISSAAILALKELSGATDNKERYKMLRKIGAPEAYIKNSLFKEIAIFFMTPLILAIIHSIFGIMFCNKILEVVSNDKLLPSIIMTAIFLILIYGGYFLITYLCSKSIIREK